MAKISCIFRALVVCSGIIVSTQGIAASMGAGPISLEPYASVGSTKAIKSNQKTNSSDETVTQRTTYGVRAGIRMSKLFRFTLGVGTNKVDVSKKAVAMRDEYGDIDFNRDANVDPGNQGGTYRYQEEQRLGSAMLSIEPQLGRILSVKVGAGVRARQRLISITDEVKVIKSDIKDPIKYNATAMAGIKLRLLGAFYGNIEYKFYFLKFPKTEPHEQEALVGFGVSI